MTYSHAFFGNDLNRRLRTRLAARSRARRSTNRRIASHMTHPQSAENPHALAHALQRLQRLVEFLARMRRRHDRPYARLALGHRGKRDPRAQHAFVEQRAREVHSEPAIANNDGSNRSLARRGSHAADIES